MCSFDDLFGSKDKTTTTTGGPDALTQQIRRMILPYAFQIAGQSFPGYDPNSRVEGFNKDQLGGFSGIRDYASGDGTPAYYDWAQSQAKGYAGAPAGSIDASTIVNDKGPLGTVRSYMDPYVRNVVKPQVREINDAATRARMANGEAATFAGAFGDARQGVADSQTDKNRMIQVGDATGKGYSDAYNNAMNLREADASRFMQRDVTNQQLREQALQRRMTGAQSSMDFGTANSVDRLQRLNAWMNAGQMQQQNGQQVKDATYENYLRGVEWPFRQYDALLSMLTGQPSTQQVTQTQQGGGSGIWGLLGSVLGSFIKPH